MGPLILPPLSAILVVGGICIFCIGLSYFIEFISSSPKSLPDPKFYGPLTGPDGSLLWKEVEKKYPKFYWWTFRGAISAVSLAVVFHFLCQLFGTLIRFDEIKSMSWERWWGCVFPLLTMAGLGTVTFNVWSKPIPADTESIQRWSLTPAGITMSDGDECAWANIQSIHFEYSSHTKARIVLSQSSHFYGFTATVKKKGGPAEKLRFHPGMGFCLEKGAERIETKYFGKHLDQPKPLSGEWVGEENRDAWIQMVRSHAPHVRLSIEGLEQYEYRDHMVYQEMPTHVFYDPATIQQDEEMARAQFDKLKELCAQKNIAEAKEAAKDFAANYAATTIYQSEGRDLCHEIGLSGGTP